MNGSFFLIPVAMMLMGLTSIIWPRTVWNFSEGWKFKNAEPTETALLLYRLSGVLIIAIAICAACLLHYGPPGMR